MDTFYNAVRKDITMIKGDTLAFNFQLQGLAGAELVSATMTCREKPESADYYFKRELNNGITLINFDSTTDTATYSVRVRPDQTRDLFVGRYYYDLEIQVDNDVLTLMKGRLTLDYDVTRR